MSLRRGRDRMVARFTTTYAGADPGFQVRGGGHLKKLRRAEGGAKFFGVFRVKNHDFTPKNHIFSNFRGGGRLVSLGSPVSFTNKTDRPDITPILLKVVLNITTLTQNNYII